MADEKVIKNPNRGKNIHEASDYQPEYIRLDKEPVFQNVKPHEGQYFNPPKSNLGGRGRPPVAQTVKPSGRPIVPVHELSDVVSPDSLKASLPAVKASSVAKLAVGHNKTWSDSISDDDPILIQEFSYDEVQSPPSMYSNLEEVVEAPKENVVITQLKVISKVSNKFESIKDLQQGDYAIIIDGKLIKKFTNVKEAEIFIENILFDGVSDVNADDIFLIKRFALKVGVLAVEKE
jgi:hypothetical protein